MSRSLTFMPSRRQPSSVFLANALCLLCAATLVSAAAKDDGPVAPHPADPYASPQTDVYNPLRYIASNSLSAVGMSLMLAVALTHTWMTWWFGGLFMLVIVISEWFYALGVAIRFGLHLHPESLPLYIVQNLFVVLSPCGFIAGEYVLLGRLAIWLKADQHVLVPPRKITLVFVLSDVSTFFIQAAGGGISASADGGSGGKLGSQIFLAGLIIQLISFAFFFALYLRFLYRVHKHEDSIWRRDEDEPWYHDWRALAVAMVISCLGILTRCIYRTIELSGGYTSRLSTTEKFFYLCDLMPLLIALVVYIPFWPGRFIRKPIPSFVENMGVAELPQKTLEESTLTNMEPKQGRGKESV